MSYFKAKMHQIRFQLGLCPRTRWGAYSAPPDLSLDLRGLTSKGRGERTGEKGKGGGEGWRPTSKARGREDREWEG